MPLAGCCNMGRKPSTDTLDFSKKSGLLDLYMPFLDCLIFFSQKMEGISWITSTTSSGSQFMIREREKKKKKKNSYLKRERPNSFQINLKDCETQVQFWLS